eukprot:TRINITY_DN7903_c0_g1_i1.p1 TRINITY_DN7903_c0_g1~~TRINITY_DN7903_c0_g1_i1.p1  ORF type:complete len:299 (-),score=32.58 TRINITY_DN7903_c0_g1_i1:68-964(-)
MQRTMRCATRSGVFRLYAARHIGRQHTVWYRRLRFQRNYTSKTVMQQLSTSQKFVVYGLLGAGVIGIPGYFGYQFYSWNKKLEADSQRIYEQIKTTKPEAWENVVHAKLDQTDVYVIGTGHMNTASVVEVEEIIKRVRPGMVLLQIPEDYMQKLLKQRRSFVSYVIGEKYRQFKKAYEMASFDGIPIEFIEGDNRYDIVMKKLKDAGVWEITKDALHSARKKADQVLQNPRRVDIARLEEETLKREYYKIWKITISDVNREILRSIHKICYDGPAKPSSLVVVVCLPHLPSLKGALAP